jgi:hypothetical protein
VGSVSTMLYRPGGPINPEAWNLSLETRVVEDSEIEGCLAGGWMHGREAYEAASRPAAREQSPFDSFLDNPVAEIAPLLADLSTEELEQLKAAEVGGKTRKGLIAKIDDELAARAALGANDAAD